VGVSVELYYVLLILVLYLTTGQFVQLICLCYAVVYCVSIILQHTPVDVPNTFSG